MNIGREFYELIEKLQLNINPSRKSQGANYKVLNCIPKIYTLILFELNYHPAKTETQSEETSKTKVKTLVLTSTWVTS